MIYDIVAMAAALARLHEGRGIEMRDAERLQIGNDRSGSVKIEIGRELQAIGRDWNGRWHQRASRSQITDSGLMMLLAALPQITVPVALPALAGVRPV